MHQPASIAFCCSGLPCLPQGELDSPTGTGFYALVHEVGPATGFVKYKPM
jgi:hypothetical protein